MDVPTHKLVGDTVKLICRYDLLKKSFEAKMQGVNHSKST